MKPGPTPLSKSYSRAVFNDRYLDMEHVIHKDKIPKIVKRVTFAVKDINFSKGSVVVDMQDDEDDNLLWKIIVNPNPSQDTPLSLWMIDPSKVVGKGAQGEVVLAQDLITKKWAAVKIIKPTLSSTEDFIREKRNLAICNRLIGTAVDESSHSYILMDYYSGVNLQDYLYETNPAVSKESPDHFVAKRPLPLLVTARLVVNIIEQVIFLHKKGIGHRDLKLENFVLNDWNVHFETKLVDLGTGIDLATAHEKATEVAGTFGYNDPALTHRDYGRAAFTFKNDLFSLGVVLAAVCSQRIYPAELRRKLLEQSALRQKDELSLEEVKALMPDMFAIFPPLSASDLAKESIQARTERALMKDIKDIIGFLTLEEPDARPSLDRLIQMHTAFKSKVARATIEDRFLHPMDPLEHYKEQKESMSKGDPSSPRMRSFSARGQRTSVTSPRLEELKATDAPRSSTSSERLTRRNSSVFFPKPKNFAYPPPPREASPRALGVSRDYRKSDEKHTPALIRGRSIVRKDSSPQQSPSLLAQEAASLSSSPAFRDDSPLFGSSPPRVGDSPLTRGDILLSANFDKDFASAQLEELLQYLSLVGVTLSIGDKTTMSLITLQLSRAQAMKTQQEMQNALRHILGMVAQFRVFKQSNLEPLLFKIRQTLETCLKGKVQEIDAPEKKVHSHRRHHSGGAPQLAAMSKLSDEELAEILTRETPFLARPTSSSHRYRSSKPDGVPALDLTRARAPEDDLMFDMEGLDLNDSYSSSDEQSAQKHKKNTSARKK